MIEVVAAVIPNLAGRYLCAKRRDSGLFEFPGGKIEPGETPEAALCRELREELALEITPLAELTALSNATHCIHFILCAPCAAEPSLTDHTEVCWALPPEFELPGRLSALDAAFVDGTFVHRGPLLHLPEVDSTNTQLLALAERGAPAWFLLQADAQTAGRGRLGRTWQSDGGTLMFSLLVRPHLPVEELVTLPLVAGLAVTQACAALVRKPLGLKWPNDVLFEDKKVAGILCESQTSTQGIEGIVIGIGINVNTVPPEMAHRGTSLQACAGQPLDVADVRNAFAELFTAYYEEWTHGGFRALLSRVTAIDAKRGKAISVKQALETLEGVSEGIGEDGCLLLRQTTGELKKISCGEIVQWKE